MTSGDERGDTRTPSDIREHYEVERQLAERLKASTRAERSTLYTALYDELLQRVPSHPLLEQRADSTVTAGQLRMFDRYLDADSVFLEIGAGDCALSLAVAERVREVYALDVSEEITAEARRAQRENLRIVVTDGLSIPLKPASVTLAFSDQLFEHLHPDDALDHLRQVHEVLRPGGRYICLTPNRLTGPHDVSKYFDETATGFHLREYSATELERLMRAAGFARVEFGTTRRSRSLRLPRLLVHGVEGAFERLGRRWRVRLGHALPLRVVLGSYAIGIKAPSVGATVSSGRGRSQEE
jgi:SAM-dependent methyltransferase